MRLLANEVYLHNRYLLHLYFKSKDDKRTVIVQSEYPIEGTFLKCNLFPNICSLHHSMVVYAYGIENTSSCWRWLWSRRGCRLFLCGCYVWNFLHTSAHHPLYAAIENSTHKHTRIIILDIQREQVKNSILPAEV